MRRIDVITKPLTVIVIVLTLFCALIGISASEIPSERQLSLCEDYAGLLSESERSALNERFEKISEKYECEVAVVTVNSLDGKSPRNYADDFYDYNGYGWGTGDDGVLLLIAMDTRDWYITTYGFGAVAFTDYGIEVAGEKIVPYMSNGDWYGAFTAFADRAEYYFKLARDGEPYDVDTREPMKASTIVLFSLVAGIIIGFISVTAMKNQLKSVTPNNSAREYIIKDSLKLSYENDRFLYRNVSRTARPKESSGSGGGGSSTHTSSSGRSHGGGGGKF